MAVSNVKTTSPVPVLCQAVVVVGQATPTQVWEFMGDFSNYKQLNPHLEQWHVLADSTHARRQVGWHILHTASVTWIDPIVVGIRVEVQGTHHQLLCNTLGLSKG